MSNIEDHSKKTIKERILGPEPTDEQKQETMFSDAIGAIIVIPIAALLIYWFK